MQQQKKAKFFQNTKHARQENIIQEKEKKVLLFSFARFVFLSIFSDSVWSRF